MLLPDKMKFRHTIAEPTKHKKQLLQVHAQLYVAVLSVILIYMYVMIVNTSMTMFAYYLHSNM